jgi:hypothetical protein
MCTVPEEATNGSEVNTQRALKLRLVLSFLPFPSPLSLPPLCLPYDRSLCCRVVLLRIWIRRLKSADRYESITSRTPADETRSPPSFDRPSSLLASLLSLSFSVSVSLAVF